MPDERLPTLAKRRVSAERQQQVEAEHGRRQHQWQGEQRFNEAFTLEAPKREKPSDENPERQKNKHRRRSEPQRQCERGPVHGLDSLSRQQETVLAQDRPRCWRLKVGVECPGGL